MLETGQDPSSNAPDDGTAGGSSAETGEPGRRLKLAGRAVVAGGLLVVMLLGVLALSARGAVSSILLANPTPAATSPARVTAAQPSPTTVPSGPLATLAPAIIATGVYWSGGGSAIIQSCDGSQTLGANTFVVDNSRSTVAVDWWVNIANSTPDGKQLWSSLSLPYGTLPAGQSVSVTVWPNPAICQQLASRTAQENYKLDVFFGGVGGAELVDSVKPPAGGSPAATPTPVPGA
jgi:hypothetical protein